MDKSKIEKTLDRMRSIPESIIKVFTDYRKNIELITKQSTVYVGATGDEIREAENKKAKRLSEAKDEAVKSLNNLRDVLGEREAIVRKQIELGLGLRLDTNDTSENLLRETRMNQAWARLKPILDKTDPLSLDDTIDRLTRQFASAADADSIATLRRELPMYIAGRVPERDAEAISEGVLNVFDNALAATTRDGSEALAYKRELNTGVYQLNLGISYCETAIKDNDLSFPMPVWKRGETLIVNEKGAEEATSKNTFQL